MSVPNMSMQDLATSLILEGFQPSTNVTNKAGQSKNVNQVETINDEENLYAPKKRKRTSKALADFKEISLLDRIIKVECVNQ
ncbi:conserved hypothetical protein [Ricinus communis]|uniref:Uncharacterized protein n=1 Tax=Ricinus communis TaxID=3988 RepID=B9SE58_RICCO|nr:conserved hypothetical protein [Ricinus communis]